MPELAQARFKFASQADGHYWVAGCCSDYQDTEPPWRFLIEVGIPVRRDLRYPRAERFLEEMEPLTLRTVEEEVLLVLGHETRHLFQFMHRGLYPPEVWEPIAQKQSSYRLELDAEQSGYDMVARYRLWRPAPPRPRFKMLLTS